MAPHGERKALAVSREPLRNGTGQEQANPGHVGTCYDASSCSHVRMQSAVPGSEACMETLLRTEMLLSTLKANENRACQLWHPCIQAPNGQPLFPSSPVLPFPRRL